MSELKSMTGYGSQKVRLNNSLTLFIELKSLNSKNLDVDVKMPSLLRKYEMECRKMIGKYNRRGKIMCFANLETNAGVTQAVIINEQTVKSYLQQINKIQGFDSVNGINILGEILKLPGVLEQKNEAPDIDKEVFEAMESALINLNNFKFNEGKSLKKHLESCVETIDTCLQKIIKILPVRKETITKKIRLAIDTLKTEVDETRYYQELTYHFEKLDISEEITRLTQHLKFFLECLDKEPRGKKLGFIGQEMGREINTIGSKAQHADIQRIVVTMKDNLEQIKEQVFNVE